MNKRAILYSEKCEFLALLPKMLNLLEIQHSSDICICKAHVCVYLPVKNIHCELDCNWDEWDMSRLVCFDNTNEEQQVQALHTFIKHFVIKIIISIGKQFLPAAYPIINMSLSHIFFKECFGAYWQCTIVTSLALYTALLLTFSLFYCVLQITIWRF